MGRTGTSSVLLRKWLMWFDVITVYLLYHLIVYTTWQHCIHFRFLTEYIIILRLWNDPFPFLLSRRCIETQWTRGNFSSKIMMTKWWEVLLLFLWLSWNRVLTEKVELRESYLKLHAVVAALMYLIHSM